MNQDFDKLDGGGRDKCEYPEIEALGVAVLLLTATAILPTYATAGAAGLDLSADLPEGSLVIAPGERAMISTGVAMAIPEGFEGQVRPRSGNAWKLGLSVLNSPGTIDSDYRGEIKVILINHGSSPVAIDHEMRIAQLVVAPVQKAELYLVESFDQSTERGAGGFGSTGK